MLCKWKTYITLNYTSSVKEFIYIVTALEHSVNDKAAKEKNINNINYAPLGRVLQGPKTRPCPTNN